MRYLIERRNDLGEIRADSLDLIQQSPSHRGKPSESHENAIQLIS